jgi:type VI secretion system FHA domain protein
MTLTLELIPTHKAMHSGASRRVFSTQGGTIGRASSCDWILSHRRVSGRHAVITCEDGVFYIVDRESVNGVFLGPARKKLIPGRRYALKHGDRITIDPYEIEVTITNDHTGDAHARRDVGDVDAVFREPLVPHKAPAPPTVLEQPHALDARPRPQARARQAPSAGDLEGASLLVEPYRPPPIQPPIQPPLPTPVIAPPAHVRKSFAAAGVARAKSPPVVEAVSAPVREADPVLLHGDVPDAGLAAVLEGAGLKGTPVTVELARSLGEILRLVVDGVMDLLRARQQIKDELRLRQTRFKTADNNPLKFATNADDALNSLLVKRHPAYLKPTEAFQDAFDDLREHQLAMLVGMRSAIDTVLAEFSPEHLEQEFDRKVRRRALLGVAAKFRYWDLYRERQDAMARDPEAVFRRVIGEPFAKAYEEQLKRLQAERRVRHAARPPHDA